MPSVVTKKKLTVSEAADQWEQARQDAQLAKSLLEESAAVLLEHFARTGRSSYRGRIARVQPAARTILDQPKVREFLGKRLAEFQTTSTPKPGLTLLERP